ncbi:MAG: PHP domain-containing protein [Armatimonadetes bacterium]|nr:PHP domain-containing protein [Armatimonadota bacterium]
MNDHGQLTTSKPLLEALSQPNGARFYKCALQVNPFAYLKRHSKATEFADEGDYNAAIVDACKAQGIQVIAVTDHYRLSDSHKLLKDAREAGIKALPGFEAVAKDGVHILCIFDENKDPSSVDRAIGQCGIHDLKDDSPVGSLDTIELLRCIKEEWGAVAIAAHVSSDGGLLKQLSGKPRANAWTSEFLLACALPGPLSDAVSNHIQILENKDSAHKREHPLAIINAKDVNSPDDLAKSGASSLIKMSHVSVEALRQAFLDPISRIRLNSDPEPENHSQFLAMAWQGGFLDGTRIHFNESLNVLVGGRGTGKSTIIESLRYVLGLEARGEESIRAHEGVVKKVLKSGTKISLLVRSYHPSKREYTIERTIPNPAVVKDSEGEVLDLTPQDVVSGVEIFGQHEISELTKSEEKLTVLLERFVERDSSSQSQRSKLRLELEKSRRRITEFRKDIAAVDERLGALPGLEETLKRYQDAGLEERLKEKSLLVREEKVLESLRGRIEPFEEARDNLLELVPIDVAFLSEKALQDMPNSLLLEAGRKALEEFSKGVQEAGKRLDEAIQSASTGIAGIESKWDELRQKVDEDYEKLLRELQKSNVDGEEFIKLRRRIEELRPLKEKKTALQKDLAAHHASRKKLLDEWIDLQNRDYRLLEKAANKVSESLLNRVRVQVTNMGNRQPLERVLRVIGGNIATLLERVNSKKDLSLIDLAQKCRDGKGALVQHYGFPIGAAERLAAHDSELFMRIEEVELPATTQIELNTGSEGEPPNWQTLQALSTGQKATAVLLLLLLDSEAPLVVDQPEDDLDNRFITEGVVPTMRGEKRRRQFLFSTHNANIPVLGDAELILGLTTSAAIDDVHGRIPPEHMGSIDSKPVQELVEEILEGGKTAFEMRRLKYGF